jgi:hypothetical protein
MRTSCDSVQDLPAAVLGLDIALSLVA